MKLLKENSLDDSDKDITSHFILRLSYCKNEELRRWFRNRETEIFKCRFLMASETEKQRFIRDNNFGYKAIKPNEFGEDVIRALRHFPRIHPCYYLVPFQEALYLTKTRRVYIKDGIAYVPSDNLINLLADNFRDSLAKQLTIIYRASQNMRFDKRIKPFINNLNKQHMGPTYTVSENTISIKDLPNLAQRSFPLCMQHLYSRLKTDNHLKHGGRMQLGLFLKGIGLSMEDALMFWRASFSKKTPREIFDRKYAYNIRHNYGKEGKRTSYTPYSCMKIINMQPGVGDFNGCPYRFQESKLRELLARKRLPLVKIQEIVKLALGKHYQIACTRDFSLSHNGFEGEKIGGHPNSWFDESQKYLQQESKKGKLL